MISGIVTDRHAIVSLTFLLANSTTFPIEFVIDTGFTDQLCLPSDAVNLLRLPFLYNLSANLADNSSVLLPVHLEVDSSSRGLFKFANPAPPETQGVMQNGCPETGDNGRSQSHSLMISPSIRE